MDQWTPESQNRVILGDNLDVTAGLPDASFTLVYLDPPFNTGRSQTRTSTTSVRNPEGSIRGFKGQQYERIRGDLMSYDDRFEDYWSFLEPRLTEAWRLLADDGTLYLHLDYREAHYAKVLLDALFGRECFLNEIIWAYDYGAKSKSRWPTKHDTILVYVKNPAGYFFNSEAVDREPYMAPGLVTPEKAARGKLPTDVWWHTIVSPTVARRPATRRRSRRASCGASCRRRAGRATGCSTSSRAAARRGRLRGRSAAGSFWSIGARSRSR